VPALSRALSVKAWATAATVAEVFGLVGDWFGPPGFRGRGGGARSGSELSHLIPQKRFVSGIDLSEKPDRVWFIPELALEDWSQVALLTSVQIVFPIRKQNADGFDHGIGPYRLKTSLRNAFLTAPAVVFGYVVTRNAQCDSVSARPESPDALQVSLRSD